MKAGARLSRYRAWVPVPAIVFAVVWTRPSAASLAVGGAAMLVGECLRVWSARWVGPTVRTGSPLAHQMVTQGPYAHTRHPIYWGNLFLAVGYAVFSGAGFPWFPLIILALFLPLYLRHARREEALLADAFPEGHAAYRERVPGWRWRLRPARVAGQGTRHAPSWRGAFRVEALTLNAIVWLVVAVVFRAVWIPA